MEAVLKEQYGVEVPGFLPAKTLKEAQQAAQHRAKYLLVYLHCGDHPRTSTFLKQILAAPRMQEILGQQVLLWGADVSTAEGYQLSFQLNATTYPFVAVALKRNIIMDLQGDFTLDDLVSQTNKAMENGAPVMAREIAFVADRESRTKLREMQERELEEARQKDMEAKRRRMREKEEAEKLAKAAAEEAERQAKEAAEKAAAEEAERKRAEEEEAAKAAAAEEKKALALSQVPDELEPHTPAGDKTTIRLMSLCGKPHEREFMRSTPLSGLYHFAKSREDYDGREFYLVCGFPPKRVECCDDKKIGDVPGLVPRSVVNMREEQ